VTPFPVRINTNLVVKDTGMSNGKDELHCNGLGGINDRDTLDKEYGGRNDNCRHCGRLDVGKSMLVKDRGGSSDKNTHDAKR
jgi:hypothetical protein